MEGDYYFIVVEKEMIEMVLIVFWVEGKKVIILFNIGNVIEIVSWCDQVDVIVLVWQGGQEVGNVFIDIFIGKVNFLGKLLIIFMFCYEDVLSVNSFFGEEFFGGEEECIGEMVMGWVVEIFFDDDIMVGYCYYNIKGIMIVYFFGYGFFYICFVYEVIELSSDQFEEMLEVSVWVINFGEFAGKEVV